jgi:pimeloyl-ACP methyl ester carboxylesterase
MRGLLLIMMWMLSAAGASAQSAAPCTAASGACTEWVTIGGGPARALIYRSYSLDVRNEHVTRLLVMVHGKNRDADNYFSTAMAAAFLAHAMEDTAIVAPYMASSARDCEDPITPPQIDFSCTGDSWRAGASALSHPHLTSFDFVDEILRKATSGVFPNLRRIVVAGHSAGGQFTTRYAMSNKLHDDLHVDLSYVVANPSSYPWPDSARPLPVGDAHPHAAGQAWEDEQPHARFEFGAIDARQCPEFNRWPFGLDARTTGYTRTMESERLVRQLTSRPTTYVLGQIDVLPLAGFDSSCAAMLQGPTRRARGEAFVAYMQQRWRTQHRIRIVPDCGHNARCVFTADEVLPLLFPPLTKVDGAAGAGAREPAAPAPLDADRPGS